MGELSSTRPTCPCFGPRVGEQKGEDVWGVMAGVGWESADLGWDWVGSGVGVVCVGAACVGRDL